MELDSDTVDAGDEKSRIRQELMIRIFELFTQTQYPIDNPGRILDKIKQINIIQQVKDLPGEEKAVKAETIATRLVDKGCFEIGESELIQFVSAWLKKPEGEGDDHSDSVGTLNPDKSISFNPAMLSTPREDLQKRKAPNSPATIYCSLTATATPKKPKVENYLRRSTPICLKTRHLHKKIFLLLTQEFNYEEGSALKRIQRMILERVESLVLEQLGNIAESIASMLAKKGIPEISHEKLLDFVSGALEHPDPNWGLSTTAKPKPGQVFISNLLRPTDQNCNGKDPTSTFEGKHKAELVSDSDVLTDSGICPVDPGETKADVRHNTPEPEQKSHLADMIIILTKQSCDDDAGSSENCKAFIDLVQDNHNGDEGKKMAKSHKELFPSLAAKLDDGGSWKPKHLSTFSNSMTKNCHQHVDLIDPPKYCAIKELWGRYRSRAPESFRSNKNSSVRKCSIRRIRSQSLEAHSDSEDYCWRQEFNSYRDNPASSDSDNDQ